MTGAVTAALLLAVTRVSIPVVAGLGLAAAAVVGLPLLVFPLGCGWLVASLARRLQRRTATSAATRQDVAALSEMTAIGLTGGLGIHNALGLAADAIGGPVGAESKQLLRRAKVDGIASLLHVEAAATPLYRTIGRAATSGASLLEAISRLAEQMHGELAAEQEVAARKLPVTLLFPLTLLILPGFILLTVAPAVLEALARLEM